MKIALAAMMAASLALPVSADDAHHTKEPASGTTVAQQSAALSEGEVRRVDKDAKKITLRHGPLQNLDMPAMTMVFQVKDPSLLEKVKVGDKVKFRAEKAGSQYIVTQIEPAGG
jgi:Cu/Ag efflux protein CusF